MWVNSLRFPFVFQLWRIVEQSLPIKEEPLRFSKNGITMPWCSRSWFTKLWEISSKLRVLQSTSFQNFPTWPFSSLTAKVSCVSRTKEPIEEKSSLSTLILLLQLNSSIEKEALRWSLSLDLKNLNVRNGNKDFPSHLSASFMEWASLISGTLILLILYQAWMDCLLLYQKMGICTLALSPQIIKSRSRLHLLPMLKCYSLKIFLNTFLGSLHATLLNL